jgi:Domain of unknown function (DUF397)
MSARRRGRTAMPPTVTDDFYKSSRSGNAGCVEVQFSINAPSVRIRDGKNRTGPELTFTPYEWAAFIAGVKSGEFEVPEQWNALLPPRLVTYAAGH